MRENHVSCLLYNNKEYANKASWTSHLNKHKLKRVLLLILSYGSYFIYLLATLLAITFPIFSAFFGYACMYVWLNK